MNRDKTTHEAFRELADACNELGEAVGKELKIYNFVEWLSTGINKLYGYLKGFYK